MEETISGHNNFRIEKKMYLHTIALKYTVSNYMTIGHLFLKLYYLLTLNLEETSEIMYFQGFPTS